MIQYSVHMIPFSSWLMCFHSPLTANWRPAVIRPYPRAVLESTATTISVLRVHRNSKDIAVLLNRNGAKITDTTPYFETTFISFEGNTTHVHPAVYPL